MSKVKERLGIRVKVKISMFWNFFYFYSWQSKIKNEKYYLNYEKGIISYLHLQQKSYLK